MTSELISSPWTAAECVAFDRHLQDDVHLPAAVLMENAGAALARHTATLAAARPDAPVLALVGPGNNGGDAVVAARHLFPTRAAELWCPLGPPRRPDQPGTAAWRAAQELGIRAHENAQPLLDAAAYGLLLDGLFGVGLTREIAGPAAAALDWADASGIPVLAVDLPSGLDADTGAILGCALPATSTLSFVAAKRGFQRGEGPRLCGEVALAGIGVSERYALDWIAARRARLSQAPAAGAAPGETPPRG